eukprot:CAMPEP_0201689108 /NCGR_PEP_ID=MMETSP0578-20130828/2749_1 /ASSEMBLY_ACC=CAM_ASM_000663 /TAXON_ID=267565 /ORGANISM="Skeletonema grethea, Strain CCMP 1804" /LENGTH=559 /DNA_ID=CAMNT_0048173635 /DNA_START=24 /DNA_END=1703 /DNA_ORIENTATION=+
MAVLRSIKLTLLLAALAVAGTAGESGELRSNHIRSKVQVNDVDVGTTTTSSSQPKTLVDAAEEFIDFEANLLKRRLQNKVETTERCNTWCMLKQSLGLTIIGLLLICVSPCLMWKNEGRHVKELRRIDFCKNKAVVIDNSEFPTDEDTGELVHFVGQVSVDDDALDLKSGALNISSPLTKALVIKRTCSIYQKFEQSAQQTKNDMIGAGQTTTTTYSIKEDWTPMGPQGPLEHFPNDPNSRGIWDELVTQAGALNETAAPAALNLPPNLPPEMAALLQQVDLNQSPHCISVSKSAHVGGFGLSRDIIMSEKAVFQSNWMQVPAELIPDHIESLPELRKDRYGNLTTVEEGDQPMNGDVMIKFEYVADGFDASFIVQQVLLDADPEAGVPEYKFGVDKQNVHDEKCFGKITDDLGVIWMVRAGRHDLKEMISMAKEDEKNITKMLRILCWILLVAGWMMLFSIFTTLLSTLPLLGALGGAAFFIVSLIVGTVCCCGVTAIAYFRYRPLITSIILATAGGIAGIIIWRLDEANEASMQPTMAPVFAPKFLLEPEELALESY